MPPRPELFALTGGYRRVPVMQIGADIYCDTMCILGELERRIPNPTFFPKGSVGIPFALARWTDGPMFDLAVPLAFAPAIDALPADLVADRARLYLGEGGDFRKFLDDFPHMTVQLRGQLSWVEQRLQGGDSYLMGDEPGMADLLVYYLVWFLRGRWGKGPDFLAEFEKLLVWEERINLLGHGKVEPMTPDDALEACAAAQPQTPEMSDARDPLGLAPGMDVEIVTDADSGERPVSGVVRAVNRDTISIHRVDMEAGLVCVHFPRVGYRVTIVGS